MTVYQSTETDSTGVIAGASGVSPIPSVDVALVALFLVSLLVAIAILSSYWLVPRRGPTLKQKLDGKRGGPPRARASRRA